MKNILYILFYIVVSICIIYEICNNKYYENFIILQENAIIPNHCPNYLYTDGIKYYLYNSKKFIDGINNPIEFTTEQEAKTYWEKIKCSQPIKINLIATKNKDDIINNYEYTCNRHIAPNNFTYENITYKILNLDDTNSNNNSNNNNTIYNNETLESLEKLKKYMNIKRNVADYDLKECIKSKIYKDNNTLKNNNMRKDYYSSITELEENVYDLL